MSDLEDYAEYFEDDPVDNAYAVVSIDLRIKKTLLSNNILSQFAAFHGWQPTDTINAADKSIAVIKGLINERADAVVAEVGNKIAEQTKAALKADF